MVPDSPVDALGAQGVGLRDLLVEVIRSRHDQAAEAHQISGSRYAMGFGTQWRDLLDDTHEALQNRGFQSHILLPAGHKIPIVNDCLVYVWRVSLSADAVADFASSPTRRNSFTAPPPAPMLFDPSFVDAGESIDLTDDASELERLVRTAGGRMPLVLVMVRSTPRRLHSIEWAVAELDHASMVQLRGQEILWEQESVTEDAVSSVESFDSGAPVVPAVELQPQEGAEPDA